MPLRFSFYYRTLLLLSVIVFGHLNFAFSSTSFRQEINQNEYLEYLVRKRSEVKEFQFIQDLAEELGIRVYLFGGTAASFAHYVKSDFIRTRFQGQTSLQDKRFDYDYMSIFRSTQDADIVVDASPEVAKQFEERLRAKFGHLQGSKTKWEVRLLKSKIKDKEALLDNFDFFAQHTDSHSVGLIDLSKTNSGLVVSDLRQWGQRDNAFLSDVLSGRLTYYFSSEHAQTARAKDGLNPPILSVIRYFTKLFQFELSPRPEDLSQLAKIISSFDPKSVSIGYVSDWIEKNGKKLVLHSADVERSIKILDEIGLRVKLIEIKKNANIKNSLAWWLSKQPLPSLPLEEVPGARTAEQLGLREVAHETSDLFSFESLIRQPEGHPNVFISRVGKVGEGAAFGPGHYTRVGRRGAAGTGFTIRYKVNPRAVEGRDFKRVGTDYVLFFNRNALTVEYEIDKVDPIEFFQLIDKPEILSSDLGILELLRRRVMRDLKDLDEDKVKKLYAFVKEKIKNTYFNSSAYDGSPEAVSSVIHEWFRLPCSADYPGLISRKFSDPHFVRWAAENIFSYPHWIKIHPKLLDKIINSRHADKEILISIKNANIKMSEKERLLRKVGATVDHSAMQSIPKNRKINRSTWKWVEKYSEWITEDEIRRAVVERLNRLEVFRDIAKFAEENNISIGLGGMSAIRWADYVVADILKEKGHPDFQSRNFSYEYIEIFGAGTPLELWQSVRLGQTISNFLKDFKSISLELVGKIEVKELVSGLGSPTLSSHNSVTRSGVPIRTQQFDQHVFGKALTELINLVRHGEVDWLALKGQRLNGPIVYGLILSSIQARRKLSPEIRNLVSSWIKSKDLLNDEFRNELDITTANRYVDLDAFLERYLQSYVYPILVASKGMFGRKKYFEDMGLAALIDIFKSHLANDPSAQPMLDESNIQDDGDVFDPHLASTVSEDDIKSNQDLVSNLAGQHDFLMLISSYLAQFDQHERLSYFFKMVQNLEDGTISFLIKNFDDLFNQLFVFKRANQIEPITNLFITQLGRIKDRFVIAPEDYNHLLMALFFLTSDHRRLVLMNRSYATDSKIIELAVRFGLSDPDLENLFRMKHWREDPLLLKLCSDERPTLKKLKAVFKSGKSLFLPEELKLISPVMSLDHHSWNQSREQRLAVAQYFIDQMHKNLLKRKINIYRGSLIKNQSGVYLPPADIDWYAMSFFSPEEVSWLSNALKKSMELTSKNLSRLFVSAHIPWVSGSEITDRLTKSWFSSKESLKFPQIVKDLMAIPENRSKLVGFVFSNPAWIEAHFDLIMSVCEYADSRPIIAAFVLAQLPKGSSRYIQLKNRLLELGGAETEISYIEDRTALQSFRNIRIEAVSDIVLAVRSIFDNYEVAQSVVKQFLYFFNSQLYLRKNQSLALKDYLKLIESSLRRADQRSWQTFLVALEHELQREAEAYPKCVERVRLFSRPKSGQ